MVARINEENITRLLRSSFFWRASERASESRRVPTPPSTAAERPARPELVRPSVEGCRGRVEGLEGPAVTAGRGSGRCAISANFRRLVCISLLLLILRAHGITPTCRSVFVPLSISLPLCLLPSAGPLHPAFPATAFYACQTANRVKERERGGDRARKVIERSRRRDSANSLLSPVVRDPAVARRYRRFPARPRFPRFFDDPFPSRVFALDRSAVATCPPPDDRLLFERQLCPRFSYRPTGSGRTGSRPSSVDWIETRFASSKYSIVCTLASCGTTRENEVPYSSVSVRRIRCRFRSVSFSTAAPMRPCTFSLIAS